MKAKILLLALSVAQVVPLKPSKALFLYALIIERAPSMPDDAQTRKVRFDVKPPHSAIPGELKERVLENVRKNVVTHTLSSVAKSMDASKKMMNADDVESFLRSRCKRGGRIVLPQEYYTGVTSGQYLEAPCNQANTFPLADSVARFGLDIKVPTAVDLSDTIRLGEFVKPQAGGCGCRMINADAQQVSRLMRGSGVKLDVRVGSDAKQLIAAFADEVAKATKIKIASKRRA